MILPFFFEPAVVGTKPVMEIFSRRLAAGVRHRAEWIVDQKHVSTSSHERPADAGSEIAAAFGRGPTAACLTVFGEPRVEHPLILFGVHEVANVATEVLREREAGRCADELLVWMTAEIPSGKTSGGQLAFAVSRRHEQHQPVNLVSGHPFELLSNLEVDRGRFVSGIGVARKVN